jgi:hypothetical protein
VARRSRRRQLHALAELHDVALLFPSIRPKGGAISAYADRLAAEIGDEPRGSTPAEVADGLRLLTAGERRRVVRSWAVVYPDRWRKVCLDVGHTALAEQTFQASAVRAAVADRIVCPPAMVATLENGELERSPVAALALAISPFAVWSYEDVLAPEAPAVTGEHVARVRAQVSRLRRRLPYEGLSRASATLGHGCELASDEAAARALAGLLLEAYALSLERRASYISLRN